MKQISAKSKIVVAIILLVIVIGAAMVGIKGFNFDIRNKTSQRIELNLKKSFEVSDIKQITNEVFGNQHVMIQKVEVYEEKVAITTKEITDEQKNSLIEKINGKYETEFKAEDIVIQYVPHTKLRDVIKPYALPMIISTIAILVYIGIRFNKLGFIKTTIKAGGMVALVEILLFALMAITRFPIGRYTLPLVLFAYLVTMLGTTIKLENDLKNNQKEEKNKK